ncbi:ABC transporter permease [Sphaerisporangium sp. NPDC004334]
MTGFLVRRAGYYLVLLTVAVFLSYAVAATALKPRAYFEGRQPRPPAVAVEAQLTHLGVNDHDPILVRFGTWAGHALTGDLGRTIFDTSVDEEFGRRVGVSLRLLLVGTLLGTVIGILAGVWSAVRQYRLSDRLVTLTSFVLLSTPVFLLAVLLKTGARWINETFGQIISYTGEKTPGLTGGLLAQAGDRAVHLLLPTLSIALGAIATYSRYQRASTLDVLGSDYLRTAVAKGLAPRTALLKHGLRVALIPLSTFFAYGFLAIFTGATLTETIFGWHGMGEWFVDAVNKNDVNAVVAVNLFAAVVVLASGLVADLLHAVLDPRVRDA